MYHPVHAYVHAEGVTGGAGLHVLDGLLPCYNGGMGRDGNILGRWGKAASGQTRVGAASSSGARTRAGFDYAASSLFYYGISFASWKW